MQRPSQIWSCSTGVFRRYPGRCATFTCVVPTPNCSRYREIDHVLSSEFLESGCNAYLNTAISSRNGAAANAAILIQLVAKLISSLGFSTISSMLSTSPEVLLWMVFIGNCAARDSVHRGWFLLELRHGVELLDLQSVNELEDLLKSLLYRENIFRVELHTIWQEITT